MKLISYRKDNEVWQTDFRLHGKRHRIKLPFTKLSQKSEAREFAKQLYMKKLRGELLEECKITFKEMAERYLDERNLREANKEYRLAIIYKFIGKKYLDKITYTDYDNIKHYLKKERGIKNQSINRYMSDVQVVMNFAKARRLIKDFPPIIKLADDKPNRRRALTEKEIDTIYNTLPEYLKDAFEFTLSTGFRKGNIVGLKRKHLTKRDDGTYKINFTAREMKAGRDFEHICTKRESEILKRNISFEHELIFRREVKVNGAKTVGLGDFKKSVISSRKKCGFYWTWHELRHTRATNYAKTGMGDQMMNKLMAWSPRSRMAGNYSHLKDENMLAKLREQLDSGHWLDTEAKNS